MALDRVLLFSGISGINTGGGNIVLGKRHGKCRRYKRVYSPRSGKTVRRCADFGGGGLDALGALPFNLEALKGTLLTGAVAVGGAVVIGKGVAYVAPMIKVSLASNWIMAIEVIAGLIAGVGVGKYANQPDLGAAIALGPIVKNGLKLTGMILAPSAAPGALAGRRQAALNAPARASRQLGATVQAGEFPGYMYQNPLLQAAMQQSPAYAY